MDTQECKVFFAVETTREQADDLVAKHAPGTKIDTFWAKREIGCNTVTFAIVSLLPRSALKLLEEKDIVRIDILTTFKAGKGGEECSGGG